MTLILNVMSAIEVFYVSKALRHFICLLRFFRQEQDFPDLFDSIWVAVQSMWVSSSQKHFLPDDL